MAEHRHRILVVEDDPAILAGLADLLDGEGYAVACAADGREALQRFDREPPALVLLDVMIPGKNGYDVCREIRHRDPLVPILMLTAKGEEVDKVAGLELGADDYIVKPFGVSELLARIRAALRRRAAAEELRQEAAPQQGGECVCFGQVRIDPRRLQGWRSGRPFALTPRELKLLQLLLARRGEVVDRNTIFEAVWGQRYEGTTRTLDQHVAQLRKKIEGQPARPRLLLTVHGVGYRLAAEEQ